VSKVIAVALVSVALAVGCGEDGDVPADGAVDAPGDAACDPAYGTLRVCVYYDETATSGLPDAEVTIRRSEDDVPWLMRVMDDGCVEENVEVGGWQLSAVDEPMGFCRTPFMPILVDPCETTTLDVYVLSSCVDG
jgi:hypothetical protein